MTTISADTSIMDFLGGSASSKYFSELEEQTELTEEQLKRQSKVQSEMESMNDSIEQYTNAVRETYNNTISSITNPIKDLRDSSISAYTNFTESIYSMKDDVSKKLTDVKVGFEDKVDNLKSGFTSSVANLKQGFTDVVGNTTSAIENMSVKMEAFKNLPTEKQLLLASKTVANTAVSAVTSAMEGSKAVMSSLVNITKTSSGYLKGLFQKSEESDDVGGTSGLAPKASKPDDGEGGDIGGLLGSLPIPKKLKGGLKSFGKFAGRLAGKIALPLAVLTAGVSFVDGIQNASEIVGKTAEEISSVEKAGAGLASLASDLTFGLISAETIYSEGKQAIEGITGFASDLYGKLPEGVRGYTDKVGEFLFSSNGGVFQSIGDLFSSTVDAIASGDWGTVALNSVLGPMKMVFGANGILANTAKGVFDLLPNSFQEAITDFGDTIMGLFDSIKNMASNLIPDSLKNFFGDVSESDTGKAVGSAIDSAKSFFGFGESKPEETNSIAQKSPMVNEPTTGNPILEKKLADNRAIIAQRKNETSSSSMMLSQTGDDYEEVGGIKANSQKIRSIDKKSMTVAKTKVVDSDTATIRSKAKMNEKKEVQPVIIQQPAPVQKPSGSGKKMNTSTSIGDTELAVMNSNMMD